MPKKASQGTERPIFIFSLIKLVIYQSYKNPPLSLVSTTYIFFVNKTDIFLLSKTDILLVNNTNIFLVNKNNIFLFLTLIHC